MFVDVKKDVVHKIRSALEDLPLDVFEKWSKNGKEVDYAKIRDFIQKNIPEENSTQNILDSHLTPKGEEDIIPKDNLPNAC